MTDRGAAIKYGDVAPGAKENFTATSNNSKYNTLAQLRDYNLDFPNFGNPCEKYAVALDGNAIAFPSLPESSNLGLISSQISNDDGTFTNPVVLTLTSDGQYSSQGLTLTFDTYNQIYPTHLSIQWYRQTESGNTLLEEMDYNPTSAFYFCQKQVTNYNMVVITIHAINMPKNRLKLRVVDYGYGTYFYGNELRSVKISQSIDPISSEIKINTVNFVLDSATSMEYSFQTKQPLSVYFNGKLRATTFVKKSTRKAKFIWEVQSEDYIGLMDAAIFPGGIYNNQDAFDLLEEIFTAAKVPCTINTGLKGVTVTGHLPYGTAREALMQVAFAVQNVVSTNEREDVEVKELSYTPEQTIPLDRIMQGQNFVDDEIVTSVEIMSHSYSKSGDETVDAYKASDSGTGSNIIVKFSEPLHSLTIKNGELVVSHPNYAVINANAGCVLTGTKYDHKKQLHRRQREDVNVSTAEKVVTIENATLVSLSNVNAVLDKCFDWFMRTKTTNLKVVEGKHIIYGDVLKYGQRKYGDVKYGEREKTIEYDKPVGLGEAIEAETEYLGNVSGTVIKQSFNLGGNILVKEVELR